jgi:FkbM family methyltransferase
VAPDPSSAAEPGGAPGTPAAPRPTAGAPGETGPDDLWRGVVLAPLDHLVPHPRNYRKHPPDQVAHLAQSIRDASCYRPVVLARGDVVLAGHGLVLALRSLGRTTAPVIRLDVDPLSPRGLKILAADNEVGHLAEIDDRALSELLREVKQQDLTGLLGTGYDEAMLANLVLVTRPASEIGTLNEAAEWVGMPAYDEGGDVPLKLVVAFKTVEDRQRFVERFEIVIDKKAGGTWSTRWPFTERVDAASVGFVDEARPPAAPAETAPSAPAPVADEDAARGWKIVQGGGVPGGHRCIYDGVRKPFITPMTECASIPLRHSDVVVDIGAYVGTYAIRCARFPVRKVIAFEPTPHTFGIFALTKLRNLEQVQAAVVGDDRKAVTLHLSAGIGVTNSLVLSNRKPGAVDVPAVRYDDVIREATIVKIDIEGGEYDLPIGTLLGPRLRALVIDWHPVPGFDWQGKAAEIMAQIEAAGFAPVIRPDWSNGWTCAGSWLREVPDDGVVDEVLMGGGACCGCSAPIVPAAGARAICVECAGSWSKKHRAGFVVADGNQPVAVGGGE